MVAHRRPGEDRSRPRLIEAPHPPCPAGAIEAIGDALRAHEDKDVRTEGVWALTVLCSSCETSVRAASRTCFEILEVIAGDLGGAGPHASAMATFLCEKIKEWRCGGNR